MVEYLVVDIMKYLFVNILYLIYDICLMKLNTSNAAHFRTDINSLLFLFIIPFNVIYLGYFKVKFIHSEHIFASFCNKQNNRAKP